MDYDIYILNRLIDKYERSNLYKGTNRIRRNLYLHFNPHEISDYFIDETSRYKQEINGACMALERASFIYIHWVKFEKGNLIDKVRLNLDNLESIYAYLKRKPKRERESRLQDMICKYAEEFKELEIGNGVTQSFKWINDFYSYINTRLSQHVSVKEYIDIEDMSKTEDIFKALNTLALLENEVPKRIFSIKALGSSKAFDGVESKITKIIRTFSPEVTLQDNDEILAELGIVKNPQYLLVSGDIELCIGGERIALKHFTPDLGLAPETVATLEFVSVKGGPIITIENLTSYHQFIRNTKGNWIVIYLGGYHNTWRRQFLNKLKVFLGEEIPFYHWGDIDYGGFTIYRHLNAKCHLHAKPYLMDCETLQRYEKYALPIKNKAYKKKLQELLKDPEYAVFHDTIEYMLYKGIRLEQECIEVSENDI